MNRIYGTALLALLRGRDPPRVDVDEALRERAAAGDDDDARATVALAEALASLPGRVERALRLEAAPVVLADGSSLALDEAERLLERKEEQRAHRPLRESIDRAAIQLLQFYERRSEPAPAAVKRARGFLSATVDLRDAARSALATLGGEPLEDPPALARALDLPDADGAFGGPATLALLAAARDACPPARRVARFAAPRLLAGAVVDDGDVHFAFPPRLARLARHKLTLTAGARALVVGAVDGGAPDPDGAARAAAFALGLSSSPARRSVDVPRSVAERACRAYAAATLLYTRARLALTGLDADARRDVDGARDALAGALGCDPGRRLTLELSAPSFDVDVDDTGLDELRAIPLALALRDAFDERFALAPAAWREHTAVVVDPALDPLPAWRTWLGELL